MPQLIIFPTPLTAHAELRHDSGFVAIGAPATHPSGRPGVGFELPATLPNGNGAQLTLSASGYLSLVQRGILYLNDGHLPYPWEPGQTAAYTADDFHLVAVNASNFGPVQISGDRFVCNGKPWIWASTSGFCDYKVFLDGGNLRALLQQNQDLGARGRRVFLNMVNIVNFDPDSYGQSFYDRLPEFVAVNAEYGQYVEFDVLPDTGYRGWSLSKCQNFWARVNDALDRAGFNHFRSLTNEFDHGGNLVGSVNDYARPGYALVSQGSAVSDAPCPRPGWGFREFHVTKPFPKIYLCEDMLFNGLGVDADGTRWADAKPIVLTETPRFDDANLYTDDKLAACLAHESLAFGNGMCLHTDSGKFSRLLTERQASCAQTAMRILA